MWFLAAAAARYLFRRGAARTVDKQRNDLAERLPGPISDYAAKLPGDPIRAVSSVVVAGRATRNAATRSANASLKAAGHVKSAKRASQRLSNFRAAAGQDTAAEIEASFRSLKSRYLTVVEGESAALDAQLDLRQSNNDESLPEIPSATSEGRMRRLRSLPTPKVGRVQRTYNAPTKPWDSRR